MVSTGALRQTVKAIDDLHAQRFEMLLKPTKMMWVGRGTGLHPPRTRIQRLAPARGVALLRRSRQQKACQVGTRERRSHSSMPTTTASGLPWRVMIEGAPRAASSTTADTLAFASLSCSLSPPTSEVTTVGHIRD